MRVTSFARTLPPDQTLNPLHVSTRRSSDRRGGENAAQENPPAVVGRLAVFASAPWSRGNIRRVHHLRPTLSVKGRSKTPGATPRAAHHWDASPLGALSLSGYQVRKPVGRSPVLSPRPGTSAGVRIPEPVALDKDVPQSRKPLPLTGEVDGLARTLPNKGVGVGQAPPAPKLSLSKSYGPGRMGLSLGRLPTRAGEELRRAASDLEGAAEFPGSRIHEPVALTHCPPFPIASVRAALEQLRLTKPETKPPWAISADALTLHERIGVGSFGLVYRGRWEGTDVAVKRLRTESTPDPAATVRRARGFLEEMQLMADLSHPHVVSFLAGCLDEGDFCVVHELCRCSLHDVLHTGSLVHTSVAIAPVLRLWWAQQIAEALAYLHGLVPPVVHRDLKSGNVLLTADWVAKVGDFGAARRAESPLVNVQTARMGTCQWTAPEVVHQRPHGSPADAYSFGMLLYELAARRMPYADMDAHQVELAVLTGQHQPMDMTPMFIGQESVFTAACGSQLLTVTQVRPLGG